MASHVTHKKKSRSGAASRMIDIILQFSHPGFTPQHTTTGAASSARAHLCG